MTYDIPDIAAALARTAATLDASSSNLSNAATPGFKEEYLYYVAQNAAPGESPTSGAPPVLTESLHINFSQGNLTMTKNPFDLAIVGPGFFIVQRADGLNYTKRGDFTLDKDGFLVTQQGEKVQGEQGPILARGDVVMIEEDGTINVDGTAIGKLKLAQFRDPSSLKKMGGGYFKSAAKPQPVTQVSLKSGYLETSNVNVIKEMLSMIEVHRTVETYQKLIQTVNDMDKLATSRIGRNV